MGKAATTNRTGFRCHRFGSVLDVAADHAAFFEVFLVVLFGLPERRCWDDLGRDGFSVRASSVELGDLCPGLGELLVVLSEDDATVLRTPIRTLAVDLGGIVHAEKRVKQRFVG